MLPHVAFSAVASSTVPPSRMQSPGSTSMLRSKDDSSGVCVAPVVGTTGGGVEVVSASASGTALPSICDPHAARTHAAATTIAAPAARRTVLMLQQPIDCCRATPHAAGRCDPANRNAPVVPRCDDVRMDLPVAPPVAPMLAKAAPSVPAQPGQGPPQWSYEPKWDGFRAI